jgi:GNAT superfamily N-acetyltransferase
MEHKRPAVSIRRARPDEGERLREIAVASKSHWGYERERVERWAADGDFSPAGLAAKEVLVAEVDGRPVAWASLLPRGEVCWLDDLWVEPEWIGAGLGSLLFRRAAERATRLGAVRLEWEAEPNAVGFYEKLGARRLRESGPSAWGRILSIYGVDL